MKADASAAGPKRFPNDSIQWIGSVIFFKRFSRLFVCYICSFSFAILFVETFSERSFRDLFVLCLKLLTLRVVSTKKCCAGAEKGEVAEVKLRPSIVTGILKNE